MGLSSAGLIAEPAGSADVRRVRPGRRRDSHGRHAPRVRVLLEPDRRALGRPPPRRAHANRDPPADGLPQIPRRSRGGRSAAEHLVGALRCLYRHAEDAGLITAADTPPLKVEKPLLSPSTRRAVPDNRLAEINQIAATTGNDPEPDTMLLRLRTETACRRGGALALHPADLDPDQCLILLRKRRDPALATRVPRPPWPGSSSPARGATLPPAGTCSGTRTGSRSPAAATTPPPPAPPRLLPGKCRGGAG